VASIAVIAERLIVLRQLKGDISGMRQGLVEALREGGFSRARNVLSAVTHPAAKIALRGVQGREDETNAEQAKEAMSAETIAQKRQLERRFGFLATLGANAPFIGLFGTVVGILQAFDALGRNAHATVSAMAPQAVMSSISEALVATAIGLGVAIPAVFAFNTFERTVRSALDDAEILTLEILSYLKAERIGRAPSSVRESPRPSVVNVNRMASGVS
jgi:biopolymer transport protein ExbB